MWRVPFLTSRRGTATGRTGSRTTRLRGLRRRLRRTRRCASARHPDDDDCEEGSLIDVPAQTMRREVPLAACRALSTTRARAVAVRRRGDGRGFPSRGVRSRGACSRSTPRSCSSAAASSGSSRPGRVRSETPNATDATRSDGRAGGRTDGWSSEGEGARRVRLSGAGRRESATVRVIVRQGLRKVRRIGPRRGRETPRSVRYLDRDRLDLRFRLDTGRLAERVECHAAARLRSRRGCRLAGWWFPRIRPGDRRGGELVRCVARVDGSSWYSLCLTRDEVGRIIAIDELRSGEERSVAVARDLAGRIVEQSVDGVLETP